MIKRFFTTPKEIPHIYPLPWKFWKAPGTPEVPQRYLDLTKHITDWEIRHSAHQLWYETTKLAGSGKLKDPWQRIMTEYDALFDDKWEKVKRLFPGMSLGIGAFGVYYVYEMITTK